MSAIDNCITSLLKEIGREDYPLPSEEEKKEELWRSLVNIRMPLKVSEDYLINEDEFLKARRKGIREVDIYSIGSSVLEIYHGDILDIRCECIVNPANEQGLGCFVPMHNCLDNQITSYAGVRLRLEDQEQMEKRDHILETSGVFMTKGYNLLCDYVIHTVGPIFHQLPLSMARKALADCYIHCLDLAREKGIRTIAFPSISTGVFGFPIRQAAAIANKTCRSYLREHDSAFDKVVLVAYSSEDYAWYEKFYQEV